MEHQISRHAYIRILSGLILTLQLANAQTPEISDILVNPVEAEIRVTATTNQYFRLLAGPTITSLVSRAELFIGPPGELVVDLGARLQATNIQFFAFDSFDRCAPADQDGDGIDDIYELERSPMLDPFRAGDATLDHDGDGIGTLQEYRSGSDPEDAADRFCLFQSQLNEWHSLSASRPQAGQDPLDFQPDAGAPLNAAIDGRSGVAQAHLDGNTWPDVVAVDRTAGTVEIFLGQANGTLGPAATVVTGGLIPTTLTVGPFVGSAAHDLAIGHLDGSVTILEGNGDGSFVLRSDLTQTGLGAIVDLTAADFDMDGDLDIVVSGTVRATVLFKDNSPLAAQPIQNDSFDNGLAQWQVSALGHATGDQAGIASVANDQLTLLEHQSFAVGVAQTFVVPPSPQTLELTLVQLGLDVPDGSIPDALDIALLDESGATLVPAIRPGTTAFYNHNMHPDGSPITRLGSATSVSGDTVTLDISSLAPGSSATLRIDLSGHPPGTRSRVVVDDIAVTPATILVDTFTQLPLSGPFGMTAGTAHCDEDGDGYEDILLDDQGLETLILYRNNRSGGFDRILLATPNYHCP